MQNRVPPLKRRDWFRLGAGALLGSGLWPGCARWSGRGKGGEFTFVVLNDTHFQSPRCPEFFDRVRASVAAQAPRPELCLVVGDLAEHGTEHELGSMREVLRALKLEFYVVPGNHDYVSDTDRSPWDKVFPNSLNCTVNHRDWQLIGLDSTQGLAYENTFIPTASLAWLDSHLPKLRPEAPTILFTHFPLGVGVKYRPGNADAALERFRNFNLVAVFNGHYHAFTERLLGATAITTNRCCSISRDNHDGSKEKGYFLCRATEGRVTRRFVVVE
jgi:hypothetical protein